MYGSSLSGCQTPFGVSYLLYFQWLLQNTTCHSPEFHLGSIAQGQKTVGPCACQPPKDIFCSTSEGDRTPCAGSRSCGLYSWTSASWPYANNLHQSVPAHANPAERSVCPSIDLCTRKRIYEACQTNQSQTQSSREESCLAFALCLRLQKVGSVLWIQGARHGAWTRDVTGCIPDTCSKKTPAVAPHSHNPQRCSVEISDSKNTEPFTRWNPMRFCSVSDPLDCHWQRQLLPVKPPPQIPGSVASVFGTTFGTPAQATFVNRFLDIRSRGLRVSQSKNQTKVFIYQGFLEDEKSNSMANGHQSKVAFQF